MHKEHNKFTDPSDLENPDPKLEPREKERNIEIADDDDLKKLAGLEDIDDLKIRIIDMEEKIKLLVERSGNHHDFRHLVLHWIAGGTAAVGVMSFHTIRDAVANGGFHIPEQVLKALEIAAGSVPM